MQIDDLVLISQSDEGLENALSILSEYCEHWLLSVNPKKTEIMIFEKKYRKSTLNKHCFHINRHNTEIVNNYTYLGINFSSNRNFKVSKSNLRYQDKVSDPSSQLVVIQTFQKYHPISQKNFLIHFFNPFSSMVQRYGVSMTKMISPTGKKKIIEKTHNYLPLCTVIGSKQTMPKRCCQK